MLKTTKTNFCKNAGVLAGTLALAVLSQTAQAAPITGAISLYGSVEPHVNSDGTGAVAANYTLAHSLVFGASFVAAGANGSFTGLDNSPVIMPNVLSIHPTTDQSGQILWEVGAFTFTLNSQLVQTDALNVLMLEGTGTISDGNPGDSTMGTWVATFTTASANTGVTFSWNASSAAVAPALPETSSTFLLLAFGLVGMGAFAYRKLPASV